MDNTLANLLGSDTLSVEILSQLQEAFDAKLAEKVAEARKEAEIAIREEFSARFNHDKETFVEAMDRMLSDVVKETEERKAAEIASLHETKDRLDQSIAESKRYYRRKLGESVKVSESFITSQLVKVVKGLNEQKAKLARKEKKLDEAYAAHKQQMVVEHAARLKKIDEFVISNVTRELTEFNQDHRALNEARARLASEAKAKLAETQKRFVAESARKVEKVVNETLKLEMTQLHEDLEKNRQNMFGRRIFEAMAAEYMSSYLAEGTELRKLQTMLEGKAAELKAVQTKLDENAKASEAAARKAKIAEDRASRSKIMSELLGSLRGEKRTVMENLLESTKTDHLRASFERLLPVVLNENGRRAPVAPANKRLVETKSPVENRKTTFTGDKSNRLAETIQAENDADRDFSSEISSILRLAGVSK